MTAGHLGWGGAGLRAGQMPPGHHAQKGRAADEAQVACWAPLGDRLCPQPNSGPGAWAAPAAPSLHSTQAGRPFRGGAWRGATVPRDRGTGPRRPLARACCHPRGCVCLKPPAPGTRSPSRARVPLLGRKLHILREREDAGPGITCRWPCVRLRRLLADAAWVRKRHLCD